MQCFFPKASRKAALFARRPFKAQYSPRASTSSPFRELQQRHHTHPPAPPTNEQFQDSAIQTSATFAPNAPQPSRVEKLRSAEPFSAFLTDTFNRQHDYLRISITEKCNLRCLYCMPEEGVPLSPKRHLLTPQEILYLSSLFVSQGVTKIRLTGGEPTVHPQILPILHSIGSLRQNGLRELALTTNGLTLHRKLDSMVEAGVTGINLSLDTLDPFQFEIMTRRRGFEQVMKSIDRILEMKRLGAPLKLKVNAVVIRGLNDAQILPFVDLTKEKDIEVRFIEYMPFDGNKWSSQKMLSYQEMLAIIKDQYPDLQKVQDHPNDTSKTYQVPGFEGRLGFITSMTENFCGSCNRLRITSDGNLKVCLFGNSEVSLRDMLRENFNNGEPIDEAAWEAMKQLEMDHKEGRSQGELGLQDKELQLLDIIGTAVKRKKARHAGIGALEHMKNRPMILIAPPPNTTDSKLSRYSASSTFSCQPSGSHNDISLILASQAASSISVSGQHARLFSTTRAMPHPSDHPPQQTRNQHHERAKQPSLTHLNSSGEAHMVNLPPPFPYTSGAPSQNDTDGPEVKGDYKPATTRIATATALVVFSNSEPYRLISAALPAANGSSEQKVQLPKGDVVATSRIAGIMASKRTADLIPLCHNIPLSGVSLDIQLISSKGESHNPSPPQNGFGDAETPFGAIRIDATVKTHAQTGVEMEALTAASVAALTAFDMCKAVDRGMRIENLRVTYKAGGRSGEWRDGIKVA